MALHLISKNVYRLNSEEDYEEALEHVLQSVDADTANEKDIESFPCVVVFSTDYRGGESDLEMDFVYPRHFE